MTFKMQIWSRFHYENKWKSSAISKISLTVLTAKAKPYYSVSPGSEEHTAPPPAPSVLCSLVVSTQVRPVRLVVFGTDNYVPGVDVTLTLAGGSRQSVSRRYVHRADGVVVG